MDKNQALIMLSASNRTAFGKQEFSQQSVPQKVFSAIWAVESEVNNGGFSQYFFNDSRETAGFVVEALERVGALHTAELCRQAIAAAFPGGLPDDSELIRSTAADFSDETDAVLNELDGKFYAYPDNLTDLLYRFVSERPEEFGELPNAAGS